MVRLNEFLINVARIKFINPKLILIFTIRTEDEGGFFKNSSLKTYIKIIKEIQKNNIFDLIDIEISKISHIKKLKFNSK